jgi:penicillin-binding protein 2
VRFRCWKDAGHGHIEAVTSLERSCDVYFYTMGARLGLDAIAEMGHALGFGRPTGIPLAGESSGIMPTVAWSKQRFKFYTLGSAVNASIGQGAVASTLIQLAVAYAAIANGGTVYQPQVALRVEAFDGSAVREFAPVVVRRVALPEENLAVVRQGLFNVLNVPSGTAYRRRLPDIHASGKTGTAQVAKMGAKRIKKDQLPWELRDHAWFVAYAPSEAPEIVVAVLNEHGGGGSSDAAPAAMAVIKAWHEKRVRTSAGGPEFLNVAMLNLSEAPESWPAAF